MAFVLPWLELIAAVLLLTGPWRGEARLILALLLAVFILAKISTEVRGLHIDCGCFGGVLGSLEKTLSGWPGLVLNGLLIGSCLVDRESELRVANRQ
jgi:hypothetical protein